MTDRLDHTVLAELQRLKVRRLTHFTPARNVPRMFAAGAIRSPEDMDKDPVTTFAATDSERFDGHPELVSCSIEFPNMYYHRIAKAKPDASNFPDWAVLFINPEVAAQAGTLFCRRNASHAQGALLSPGLPGLRECYAHSVVGRGGTYVRGNAHHPASPTDVQAEVLVPAPIPLSSIQEVVMPSIEQVRQERGRLRQLELDPTVVPWAASAALFSVMAVTRAVQHGHMIDSTPWTSEMETSS